MCTNNVDTFTCGHNRVLGTTFCSDATPTSETKTPPKKLTRGWSFPKVNTSKSRPPLKLKPYPNLKADPPPSRPQGTACKNLSNNVTTKECLCLSCLTVLASGTEDEMIKFQLEHNTNRHFWADWLDFIIYQTTPNDRLWILQRRERAHAREVFRQLRNSIFNVQTEDKSSEECDLMQPV